MYDCVSNVLSICAALTPSVLRLLRDHRHVFELRRELALEPEAGRVGAAEELVGDQTIVHTQPVGELALGAAHARERRDPAAERRRTC